MVAWRRHVRAHSSGRCFWAWPIAIGGSWSTATSSSRTSCSPATVRTPSSNRSSPLEAAQLNSLECPTSLRHWRCLVSGSTCKIADFGLAKDVAQDEASTILGTIKYMAPEMFAGAMYDGSKSDIWAAGVCLYCMTECRFPFTPPEGGNGGAGGIDVHKVRARSLPAVQC